MRGALSEAKLKLVRFRRTPAGATACSSHLLPATRDGQMKQGARCSPEEGAGDGHPLLLPAAQLQPALAHNRVPACGGMRHTNSSEWQQRQTVAAPLPAAGVCMEASAHSRACTPAWHRQVSTIAPAGCCNQSMCGNCTVASHLRTRSMSQASPAGMRAMAASSLAVAALCRSPNAFS